MSWKSKQVNIYVDLYTKYNTQTIRMFHITHVNIYTLGAISTSISTHYTYIVFLKSTTSP